MSLLRADIFLFLIPFFPLLFMPRHTYNSSLIAKKAISVATTLGLLASSVPAFAAFQDVPSGAYYQAAAEALVESGALEDTARLRPSDIALRSEVAKMLVLVYGEPLSYPETSNFNDVSKASWYFPYFESAANAGWIKGDKDCYKSFRPCYGRPGSGVNRAEMAALLVRAFDLQQLNTAPRFPDVPTGQWYSNIIQTAADHCILQGDSGTGNVRPASQMNRAEMITMFHRASLQQKYGQDCGPANANILSISQVSDNEIRVVFNVNVDETRAEDDSRYTVTSGGSAASVDVERAIMIDPRTVELTVDNDLESGLTYTVRANNLLTYWGFMFSDQDTFRSDGGIDAEISQVSVLSNNRVRITFSADLDEDEAEDESNFAVNLQAGGGSRSVTSATLASSRVVELTLGDTLVGNSTYMFTASGLLTESGTRFSDSATFAYSVVSPEITSVTVLSNNRLRVVFGSNLQATTAEDESRYTVRGGTGITLGVSSALQTANNTVELVLNSALTSQRGYTLDATAMRTDAGDIFSTSEAFVYAATNRTFSTILLGAQEVPANNSTMTGTGSFTLTSNGLQYDITVRNMTGSSIASAHFHRGATGVNGPVVSPITFSGNRATGTWTLSETDRFDLLAGNIYINVHTAIFPNGEIRGQLQP